MESEKYKISLIVERRHLPPSKLWLLWEHSCQEPPKSPPDFWIEIVKYKFRVVLCASADIAYPFLINHWGDLESQGGASVQQNHDQLHYFVAIFPPHH